MNEWMLYFSNAEVAQSVEEQRLLVGSLPIH
jgi:hypothetical protein